MNVPLISFEIYGHQANFVIISKEDKNIWHTHFYVAAALCEEGKGVQDLVAGFGRLKVVTMRLLLLKHTQKGKAG